MIKKVYTMEDYNKVLELKKKGLSQNKISEITGVNPTSIWYWANTNVKPYYVSMKNRQRKLPEKSKKLSKELAYIYGVLIGDGHIDKKGGRIGINVSDKDFALNFSNVLKKWTGLNPTMNVRKVNGYKHKSKYDNWIETKKDQYVVRLGSVQIVEFLANKIDTRTYSWNVPNRILKSNRKEIIVSFLKGIFDSEGCMVYDKKWNKKRIDLRMYGRSVLTLKSLLGRIGINSCIKQYGRDKSTGMFLLRIISRKDLNLYNKYIGFIIKRKRIKLEEALSSFTRDAFDGDKTKKEIFSSLKNNPKTINEISKDTKKHRSTIRYHLKRLEGKKVKIIGKKIEVCTPNHVWSLI